MDRRPRKVEILGGGFSKGTVPPLDPAAEERWGFNATMFVRYGGTFDDWTRWFDLHGAEWTHTRHPDRIAWYQRQTKPIYRWTVDPSIPSSVAYPLGAIRGYFADDRLGIERDYHGSLSWMLALAIFEGFTMIDVFWCPLDDAAHRKQVASVRYWMGQARGRGISVVVHGDSAITAYEPLYGLETT